MICCRLLSTRPLVSQALRVRLTVCSVVPVICAMSCRLIGKSISMPCSTLLAGLLDQPQQRVRDALLNLLGRHLEDTGVGLLEPRADGLQRVGGERRKFLDQAGPCPDGQTSTTLSSTAVAVAG